MDKWKGTKSNFTKVWDYERNIPSGERSYWIMDAKECKVIKCRGTMKCEVYDHMASWLLNASRSMDPTRDMDSTTMGFEARKSFFLTKICPLHYASQCPPTSSKSLYSCHLVYSIQTLIVASNRIITIQFNPNHILHLHFSGF